MMVNSKKAAVAYFKVRLCIRFEKPGNLAEIRIGYPGMQI
jgi:hypothetical protein